VKVNGEMALDVYCTVRVRARMPDYPGTDAEYEPQELQHNQMNVKF